MIELLTMIRDFFGNRHGTALIGLIAVISLIWFASPLIGLKDPELRLLLIFGILLFYLLIIFIRWLWARSRGANLHKKLQAHEEQQAGRELEIALLKEKMSEAITSLKSSELGVRYRGDAALYALPWFMIIGPSASGKSTLFRNSGLHFPFSSREDLNVKGFGGTRNCDWWFADEAILLDTAGRYTTEDDDREEWRAFLQLLKKYRPRLPINGIIVSMSLVDILTADLDGITWHVKVIRERINELYSLLGYVFPVYLILTKCDLLKGFREFFADLGEVERCQIWGLNLLDVDSTYDKKITIFENRLQNLYQKLTALRLHKLSLERNLQRKAEIFEFPEQFHASITKIMEFIKLLFKDNPYQENPHFCGAYFTSGTQEGTPIQSLIGNLRAAFGYIEQKSLEEIQLQETKSYFIKNVFSDVIFTHKNISAKTRQRLHLQRGLKSATVVTAGVIIIATFMLYSTSLTSNAMLLWHGERIAKELAENYHTNDYTSRSTLAALLDTGDYYQLLRNYNKQIPWYLRMGLYRGSTQIPPLEQMLAACMHPSFLTPMNSAITQQLQNYSQQWDNVTNDEQQREQLRGSYYTLLRAYLMMGFPARINVDQATPSLATLWSQTVMRSNSADNFQQQQELQRYANLVRFYLSVLQQDSHKAYQDETSPLTITVQGDVVDKARQQLYSPTNANNLYAQLRSTGEAVVPALTLQQLLSGGGNNLLVSTETLSGIYTAKGWQEYMQKALGEMVKSASAGDWVMDTPLTDLNDNTLEKNNHYVDVEAEQRLTAELRQLYFDDYARAWFTFLSSIQVAPFSSLDDAISQFKVLESNHGPLVQLMQVVTENIDVKDGYSHVTELKPSFDSLRKIVTPGIASKTSAPIKSYLEELTHVQGDLQRLSSSSNQDRDAQQYAASLLAGSGNDLELNKSLLAINMVVDPIDNSAAKEALKSVLLQPIRAAWRAILLSATRGVEQQWQTQVYSNYQQNIAGRFPFTRNATSDVSFNDINDFFQPKNGLLWTFINTDLTPYLYADANGWHEQQWLGVGAGFSPEFLQALTHAKLLSEGLFKGNNDQPGFSFQIYPEPTPGLSQIILMTNGQTYRYENGPQQWQMINWPGTTDNQTSQLTVIAATGLSPDTLQAQGSWGLFHLLAQSQLTPEQGAIYRATWTLRSNRDYPVTLLFQADSQNNVFQQLLINQFILPAELFTREMG